MAGRNPEDDVAVGAPEARTKDRRRSNKMPKMNEGTHEEEGERGRGGPEDPIGALEEQGEVAKKIERVEMGRSMGLGPWIRRRWRQGRQQQQQLHQRQ